MNTVTLEEVNSMGFVEKPYRPWIKSEGFMIQLFSGKWIDLFQQKGGSMVYLATVLKEEHT